MNKTYLRNNKRSRWFASWTFTLMALALAVASSPLRTSAARVVTFIVLPFWHTGQFIVEGTGSLAVSFKAKKALMAENDALKAQAKIMSDRLNYLDVLHKENTDLKGLLLRKQDILFSSTTITRACPPTERSVGARTILSPSDSYYMSMLIDVGSNLHVWPGDKVYTFGDIILGTISDSYPTRSRVRLFSGSGVSTSVFLGNENIAVAIVGDGNGTFVTTLPKNAGVVKGDKAVLQAGRPAFIATVEDVKEKDNTPFSTIFLKSPVNLNSLQWVYVDRRSTTTNFTLPACLTVTY